MTWGAYVRVSTDCQNEDSQVRELRRWFIGQGIDPDTEVLWFIDHDSGDDLDRPEFERLQREIFIGVIKAVAVWNLDRLSRTAWVYSLHRAGHLWAKCCISCRIFSSEASVSPGLVVRYASIRDLGLGTVSAEMLPNSLSIASSVRQLFWHLPHLQSGGAF